MHSLHKLCGHFFTGKTRRSYCRFYKKVYTLYFINDFINSVLSLNNLNISKFSDLIHPRELEIMGITDSVHWPHP